MKPLQIPRQLRVLQLKSSSRRSSKRNLLPDHRKLPARFAAAAAVEMRISNVVDVDIPVAAAVRVAVARRGIHVDDVERAPAVHVAAVSVPYADVPVHWSDDVSNVRSDTRSAPSVTRNVRGNVNCGIAANPKDLSARNARMPVHRVMQPLQEVEHLQWTMQTIQL